MRLSHFIADENGAITVDWVVLSASALGLALAATGMLHLARGSIGLQLDEELSNDDSTWEEASGDALLVAFEDFTDGTGAFTGARSEYVEGFGDILGRQTGSNGAEQVRGTFQLESGYDYAVITFDFLAIDSWDSETFSIFVDGQEMASQDVWWRSDNTDSFHYDDGIFASVDVFDREATGGNTRFTDQTFRITLVVADPGETISLGFGSDTNAGRNNESWGIDNFSIVQTDNHSEAADHFDD